MAGDRVQVLSLGDMVDVERQLESGFEVHRATGVHIDEVLARHGRAIRGIATRGRDRLDAASLARLPALEIIANFGVGYDSIDVDAAARRGVMVTNTPEVLNDEVADFAVALLLATVRRLPQADRFVRAGRWLQGNFPLGPTLRDRTVGLVGMGRIGERIARRLAAFEVPIVYHARRARPEVPYRHYPELLTMAKDVDTLVAILPGGAPTRGLIDAAVLAALGPRGILINVARGSVVDERALVDALRSGRAARPCRLAGARQRGPRPARRLGHASHARAHGRPGGREPPLLVRGTGTRDARPRDALETHGLRRYKGTSLRGTP